jgi:hypothetical protein
MGTSGAYSGSAGWSSVGEQTQEWLDGGAGVGGQRPNGDASGSGDIPPPSNGLTQQDPSPQPSISPPLASLIGHLGARLSSSRGNGGGGGGVGGRGEGPGGGATGRGRSTSRASSAGGRAAAGVYGLRAGNAGVLGELGLSLDQLRGLPKHEQAKRLLDAAMGPSGGVAESELRLANAELILWALNEETEPAPIDLANRWVVEYAWQVWITEAGPTIRNHSANGYDSKRVEDELRAALEATVAAGGLPGDRPLTTRDFAQAIESALGSLARIGGKAS